MSETPQACIYCGKHDSTLLFQTKDIFQDMWSWRKCRYCQAYFISPFPSAAQLNRAYSNDYYGEGDEKFEGFIERQLDAFRKQRAQRLAKHAGFKGKVLDIGCGNGKFLKYIAEAGNFRIYGIEMPGASAERAAKIPGIHLKKGTLEAGDFPADSFHAISMIHVFEHLTHPAQTLSIIDNILKPGGLFMVSFPNIESAQAKCFKGRWLHLDPPRHLFFFGPGRFKQLMAEKAYTLVSERYFSPEYNPYGMQQSLLNMLLSKREVLYEHLKGNKAYCHEYAGINLLMQKAFAACSLPVFIITDLIVSAFKKGATVEFIFRKNDSGAM